MDIESIKVCAIIVSFHPDHTLLSSVQTILPQVAAVIVVDNGSADAELTPLLHFNTQCQALEILALGRNFGLAYAQNKGIEWALAHHFTHVLILDQDSLPQEHMVKRLVAASCHLTQQGHKVSVVGPQAVDQQSGRHFFFVRYGVCSNLRLYCPLNKKDAVLAVDFLIASGSLITADVLRHVGLMNEALFIDQVDTEWCLRASFLGYQAFGVCDAVLLHSLGDTVIPLRFLSKKWHISTHSPLRDYYLFRNTLWLFFQKTTHWRWVLINIRRLLLFFIFFGLFVPPRRQRLSMMLKGIWHGLSQRMPSHKPKQ
jgi:rhamnosyltransferase